VGNTRIAAFAQWRDSARTGRIPFLCECGDVSCREHVRLTIDAYQATRNEAGFVLATGHTVSGPHLPQ
jgi:hypothetical protein